MKQLRRSGSLDVILGMALKAYGQPDRKETKGAMIYLSYNKLHTNFTLAENKLVDMMFKKP